MNKYDSIKSWAVHPKPQEDELLSSWFTRVAIGNGISPARLWRIVIPELSFISKSEAQRLREYSDIDNVYSVELFNLLSKKTLSAIDRIEEMSLESFFAIHSRFYPTRRYAPWILPKQHSQTPSLPGIQFCPECLSEDNEPYFRRKWRLSFVFSCVKHRRILLDKCPNCSHPLKFLVKELIDRYFLGKFSFISCCYCGFNLCKAKTFKNKSLTDHEILTQSLLLKAVYDNWIYIPKYGPTPSLFYFLVVYMLINRLTVESNYNRNCRQVCEYFDLDCKPIYYKSNFRAFEILNVEERRMIIGMIGRLLNNWSENFIKFCKTYFWNWHIVLNENIAGQFSYTKELMEMNYVPFWYFDSIKEPLLGIFTKEMIVDENWTNTKGQVVWQHIESNFIKSYSIKDRRYNLYKTKPCVILEIWRSELLNLARLMGLE